MLFKVCLTVLLVMGLTMGVILDLMSKQRIRPSRMFNMLTQVIYGIMMTSVIIGSVALIWGL